MGWTEYYNSEDDSEICHSLDYHRNLNFSLNNEDDDYAFSKKKTARDPMSHRIIEKRRRDRMNNCLADLSRLLPATYLKKGRGRIEKTEIIEMAIKHLSHLQAHACKEMETCEIVASLEKGNSKSDQYRSGYLECMSEVMQFLERERFHPKHPLCIRLLSHLQKHCENIMPVDGRDTKSSSSSTTSLNEDQSKWNRNESISSEEMIPTSSVINPKRKLISQMSDDNSHHSKGNDGNNCIKEEQSPVQSLHHSGPNNDSNSFQTSPCSGQDSDETNVPSISSRMHNSISPLSDHQEQTCLLDQDNSAGLNGRSNSSQLREMLLANTGILRTQSSSSSNSSSRHTDDSNGMYKFKTNIQQRFTADLEHPQNTTNSTSHLPSNNTEQTDIPDRSMKRRKMFHDERKRQNSTSKTVWENGERLVVLDSISTVRLPDEEVTMRANSPVERPLSLPPTSPPNLHYMPNTNNHSYEGEKNELPPKIGSPIQQNMEQDSLPVNSAKRERNNSGHLSQKTESNQRAQRSWENRNTVSAITTESIPIFALHPKGSFYVPMSVESQMIGSLFSPAMESSLSQPVLHPITINVNFCHPHKTQTSRCADVEHPATRSAPSNHQQPRVSRNVNHSPSFPDCHKYNEVPYVPTPTPPLIELEKQWHQEIDVESHTTNHNTTEDHCSRYGRGNGNVRYLRNDEQPKNSRISKDHDMLDAQENRRDGFRREGNDSVPNSNRNRDCLTSANSSRWSYLMAINKRTHPP